MVLFQGELKVVTVLALMHFVAAGVIFSNSGGTFTKYISSNNNSGDTTGVCSYYNETQNQRISIRFRENLDGNISTWVEEGIVQDPLSELEACKMLAEKFSQELQESMDQMMEETFHENFPFGTKEPFEIKFPDGFPFRNKRSIGNNHHL